MELVGEGQGCCEGRVEAQGIFVAGPGEAGLGPLVIFITLRKVRFLYLKQSQNVALFIESQHSSVCRAGM